MMKSLPSKLHLKQRLYFHHMGKSTYLEDHLTTFKEIVFDLKVMEVKYDEEDLGLILLCLLLLFLIRIPRILFCIVVKPLLWMKYMIPYFQRRR